ncbi:MAG TPA: class I SAM-dependent methyltransferase [Phycisphaerae bacterium]|nr:class I SAM-dependent methyltransferase [Phycisphaerae bacterium]
MKTRAVTIPDVEGWNDDFARENDIDRYYDASGCLIRWIESRRLAAIRRMAHAHPDDRILEVGCGGGHVLRMFSHCDLTGIDVSGEMLAKARRNLAGCRVNLLKGQMHELDLPAGGFDTIICTEVLEHVVDPEGILEQIGRLLRPGGVAVVTFPNDPLVNGLKRIIRRCGLTVIPPLRRISWGGDHYHLHEWTIKEMRGLLRNRFTIQSERFAPCRLLPIRCCFQCTMPG